jgi:hypothetical protein
MNLLRSATEKVTTTAGTVAAHVPAPADLSLDKIVAGLTEALEKAAAAAVGVLSAAGGFAKSALRIKLPDNDFGNVLNKVRALPGAGAKVDQLDDKMNEGAELAVKSALGVLIETIKAMTFDNAKAILNGPHNAATQYFERVTRVQLFDKFYPIVKGVLADLGVMKLLEGIVEAYNAIPFHKAKEFDFSKHVCEGALTGLFQTLEGEEAKIRTNPAFQTSENLKQVFGHIPRPS